MILTIIYLAILLSSLIVAIVCRNSIKKRRLSIFIPYLAYVFIQEFGLNIIFDFVCPGCATHIFYNFYRPVSVILLSTFFYAIPFNLKQRKVIIWAVAIYLSVTVFTFTFIYSLLEPSPYLSGLGGLLLTCFSLITIFNYFNLDNIFQEKHWIPVVWICIGITIFYPVLNISSTFHDKLLLLNANIFGDKIYRVVPKIMSLFMYSCFIYAFYLCKKND